MVLSKFFGSHRRREDDRHTQTVIAGILRTAVGDLGSPEAMPLALYCVSVIAGHAMQQVALAERIAHGLPHQAPDVVPVTSSAGRTYVFGDSVAAALLRKGDKPGFIDWMAVHGKLVADDRSLSTWFGKSAATVGGQDYGRPSPPLDRFGWPAIVDVMANADAVFAYLRSGGLAPGQFGDILTNAARVALLRAADHRQLGSLADFAVLAIEAAIAGSHMLPVRGVVSAT
jgi:hypothetical protein